MGNVLRLCGCVSAVVVAEGRAEIDGSIHRRAQTSPNKRGGTVVFCCCCCFAVILLFSGETSPQFSLRFAIPTDKDAIKCVRVHYTVIKICRICFRKSCPHPPFRRSGPNYSSLAAPICNSAISYVRAGIHSTMSRNL